GDRGLATVRVAAFGHPATGGVADTVEVADVTHRAAGGRQADPRTAGAAGGGRAVGLPGGVEPVAVPALVRQPGGTADTDADPAAGRRGRAHPATPAGSSPSRVSSSATL